MIRHAADRDAGQRLPPDFEAGRTWKGRLPKEPKRKRAG